MTGTRAEMLERQRLKQEKQGEKKAEGTTRWDHLIPRINDDAVIPIISNAVRADPLFFGVLLDGEPVEPDVTPDEYLAELWADRKPVYPFPDRQALARVAQHKLVKGKDPEQAKRDYLSFLKEKLLDVAEENPLVAGQVGELRAEAAAGLPFSDIARMLGYPRFDSPETDDSLRLLARLNTLSIYVTTSPYDFMEQALEAENRKNYRTQICFWRGEPTGVRDEHRKDRDYRPTPQNPVVYHLFGHEQYPDSIVLAEDDYVDFLMRVSRTPVNQEDAILPGYLPAALRERSLLVMGYRLQDWDFRALFRGIVAAKPGEDRRLSLAIQFKPSPARVMVRREEDREAAVHEAEEYLQKYIKFIGPANFDIEWENTDRFIRQLVASWQEKQG